MEVSERARPEHPVPAPVRIAFVDLPPMMNSIVEHELQRARGVVRVPLPLELTPRLLPLVDAVVVAVDHEVIVDRAHEILERWPNVRVIAARVSGRSMVLYELRPRRVFLGDLDVAGILAVLRDMPSYGWQSWEADPP